MTGSLRAYGGRMIQTDGRPTVEMHDPNDGSKSRYQYRRTTDGGLERRVGTTSPWGQYTPAELAALAAVRGLYHPILDPLGLTTSAIAARLLGSRGGSADSPAQRAQRAAAKPGSGRPRLPEITDEQIQALSDESGIAGDLAQVAICRRALAGSVRARRECRRVIGAALAMHDDDCDCGRCR